MISSQNLTISSYSRPPAMIIVDSYSDLTDQKFSPTNGSPQFMANFSDVCSKALSDSVIVSEGLLDLTKAENLWRQFLDRVAARWGEVPTFMITYPDYREKRPKFIQRARQIDEIFLALEQDYENVELLNTSSETLGLTSLDHDFEDSFPYHYPPELYQQLAERLIDRLPETDIETAKRSK